VYGVAGRVGALRRVLDAALAAGEDPSALLGLVAWLPPEKRAQTLAEFLAAHPEAKPAPFAVAWAWIHAQAPAKALPAAVEHLTAVRGADPTLVAQLYLADADRADFVLWKLATEQDWPVAPMAIAIAGASGAGRADLVPRWQQRIQRAQPAVVVHEAPQVDLQQAVGIAEQAAREDPEETDRWIELARARAEAGDRRGAVAAWRTAVEKSGPDAEVFRAFAAFDAAAAFSTIEAAARDSQEDDVLLAYVQVCLRVGKPDEAGAAFFRMHTLEVDDWLNAEIAMLAPWPALARVDRVLAHRAYRDSQEMLLARADALLALGRGSAAYDAYQRYEDVGGHHDRAWDGLLRSDPVRAAARFDAMRTASDAETGDRIDSVHALALLRAGRTEAAKAAAEPVLARWETEGDVDGEAVPRLAPVFPERVIALAERLVAEGALDRRFLGESLAAIGRTAGARAAFDAHLQEGNDDPRLLVARGRCR
jgi:tetratricopeptide (TPR) repeat protein